MDPSIWNSYRQDEALLFRARFGSWAAIAREWDAARKSAASLRSRHGTSSPFAIAALENVPILLASWQTDAAGILIFGECRLDPPRVSINAQAIRLVSTFAHENAGDEHRDWFDERRITDCVAAHELFHVLYGCNGSPAAEAAAHVFARALLGLSYSTLAYEHAARLALSERDRRAHALAMAAAGNDARPAQIHGVWRELP